MCYAGQKSGQMVSRVKDALMIDWSAGLVGRSVPPVLLKVLFARRRGNWSRFRSRNLLTALGPKENMGATEV